MINTSHTSPKRRCKLCLAFKVSDTAAGSFTIGRRGFLLGPNGMRVPYKVIICSLTGKGMLELDRSENVKRA